MTWVVIVKGIDAPAAAVDQAVAKIKAGLGLPYTGTVTIREWLFNEATGRKQTMTVDGLGVELAEIRRRQDEGEVRDAVCARPLCGVPFSYRYTTGRPRKFCSPACRAASRTVRIAA